MLAELLGLRNMVCAAHLHGADDILMGVVDEKDVLVRPAAFGHDELYELSLDTTAGPLNLLDLTEHLLVGEEVAQADSLQQGPKYMLEAGREDVELDAGTLQCREQLGKLPNALRATEVLHLLLPH